MTFRPTWGTTIAAALGLAILLGLGTWQLGRRAEMTDLVALRAARTAAPPIALREVDVGSADALAAMEFRRIRLAGQYLADAEIKLLNRTRDGRAGFHVVTPFAAADGAATVLIDRGWAPLDGPRAAAPPTGPVVIDGYLRLFAPPGRFTPPNDPAAATWFSLDPDAIAAASGLRAVAPFYLQLGPGEAASGAYPIGALPETAVRSPHLQYALTWYALAVVLAVIYVLYHLRRGRADGRHGQ